MAARTGEAARTMACAASRSSAGVGAHPPDERKRQIVGADRPAPAEKNSPARVNRGTIVRMTRDTGFPTIDAQYDYLRARRRHVLERLKSKARLARQPDAALLDFDDVVDALGWVGGCDLGIQTIALDSLVGSVGLHEDFDRRFRP
ncbi:MAG: hypothetical protein LC744_05550, partial [Chloroflexi bacterium]|nr:hypothetical protein [Chloroflexota bacterium]